MSYTMFVQIREMVLMPEWLVVRLERNEKFAKCMEKSWESRAKQDICKHDYM